MALNSRPRASYQLVQVQIPTAAQGGPESSPHGRALCSAITVRLCGGVINMFQENNYLIPGELPVKLCRLYANHGCVPLALLAAINKFSGWFPVFIFSVLR